MQGLAALTLAALAVERLGPPGLPHALPGAAELGHRHGLVEFRDGAQDLAHEASGGPVILKRAGTVELQPAYAGYVTWRALMRESEAARPSWWLENAPEPHGSLHTRAPQERRSTVILFGARQAQRAAVPVEDGVQTKPAQCTIIDRQCLSRLKSTGTATAKVAR